MGIALICLVIGCIIMLFSIYDHSFIFAIGAVLAIIGAVMICLLPFTIVNDDAIMQEYTSAVALNEHFLIVDDDKYLVKYPIYEVLKEAKERAGE